MGSDRVLASTAADEDVGVRRAPPSSDRQIRRRLLTLGRRSRPRLGLAIAAGLGGAVLLVVQAWLLGRVITRAFLGGQGLAQLQGPLAGLLLVTLGRALLGWAGDTAGHRAAARVKSELRERAARHLLDLGPVHLGGERTGELVNALTVGVEALDGYYSVYLPQLVLAVVVPLLVIGWVLPRDALSAAIMALTAPLVPVFMALIGLAAQRRTERQWEVLSLLSAHFLDVLGGLPTLRVFGRARAQAEIISGVTDRYRRATMGTLRVGFLSALVLEMFATVSTALVAVAIGLRLVSGGIDLEAGLAILILTPEVYLPLRRLGAQFHASAETVAAATRIFELLDTPATHAAVGAARVSAPPVLPGKGEPRLAPAGSGFEVRFESVTADYPERERALREVTFTLHPGELVALTGPSGSGKSTVAALLLRFLAPSGGRIMVDDTDLEEIDVDHWRRQVAWMPQAPHLFTGSIADNIRLGHASAGEDEVFEAAAQAGLAPLLAGLPLGLATEVGERGRLLSAGQRQRVALARALHRPAPLLILDEPTANLDVVAQAEIGGLLGGLTGRTILLIVHRPALAAFADRTVRL